jgi:hypothetical protein
MGITSRDSRRDFFRRAGSSIAASLAPPLLAAPPAASIEPAVVNGDLNNVPWQHLLMRPYLVAGIPCFLERHFAGRV